MPCMVIQAHIGALLLSKFTSYQDFHTQLYTCAAEFDFLSLSYALALSVTLLLPVGCVLVGVVVWRVVGRLREWSWRVQDTTTAVSSKKIDTSLDLLPEVRISRHLFEMVHDGIHIS